MIIAVVVSGSLAVAAFAALFVVAGACALIDDTAGEERAGERLRAYLEEADTDRAGASRPKVIAVLVAALVVIHAVAEQMRRRTAGKASRSRKEVSA